MAKLKRKKSKIKKSSNPYSKVRKKIPRTGGPMKSKTDYYRKQKHRKEWSEIY